MKFQKLLLLLAGLLTAAGLSAMQPGPGFEDSDYPSSESESDIEETPVMKKAADSPLTLPKKPGRTPYVQTMQWQGDYDKQPFYGTGLEPQVLPAQLEKAGEYYSEKQRAYPALPQNLYERPLSRKDYDRPMRWKDAIPAPAALEMEKPTPTYTAKPQSPVTVEQPQAAAPMSAGSFYSVPQKPAQQLPVTIVQPKKPAPRLPVITVAPPTTSQEPMSASSFYSAPQRPTQTTVQPTIQPISQGGYDIQPKQKVIVTPSESMQKPVIVKPVVAKPAPQLPVTVVQQPAYTAHPASPVNVVQPAAAQPMVAQQPAPAPQPAAAQGAGILAMLLGRARQHSEFEIAITNSTNDTYRIEHNGQSLALAPGQQQQINLENLPTKALQPIVRTRIVGGRQVSQTSTQKTYDTQPIKLVNVANNQQYALALSRTVNAKGQINIIATIAQGHNAIRNKTVMFAAPAAGQRVYYVINVNLQGDGLNRTNFDITPTLAE